ncbi:MAG: hypothetical protein Q4B26_11980 [Eubacteriales bacterium]|nr:hypothetical protein [Eubacteriales bacterium]
MIDKNGREIKSGDVVIVEGAYFDRHNGRYVVTHSPGDEHWSGKDHCMVKIKRNGKVSTGKYRHCFWPIMNTINNRDKKIEAKEWNREHATIEVVGFMGIPYDEL